MTVTLNYRPTLIKISKTGDRASLLIKASGGQQFVMEYHTSELQNVLKQFDGVEIVTAE